ncbi:MAG: hypothetical protein LBC83_02245 [Oscillospiraceae bacterium]|nr:hypothetical protein [Oscillospiraceae bacterium]
MKLLALMLSLLQTLISAQGILVRPVHIPVQESRPVNVFVAGLLGFGETTAVNFTVPYWGTVNGNIQETLEREGFPSYAASCGPLSSAWDRACELYAQLAGGTVDYGEAHAAKYGHARYGRTYEPLFEGWSTAQPVNLIGHSFGGPTIDLFTQLCAAGSAEERAATTDGTLSPFFQGGLVDRIHSVTTLASPHNGTTADVVIQNEGEAGDFLGALSIFAALGNAPGWLNGIYDVQLEHWGLSVPPGEGGGAMPTKAQIQAFAASGDNALYDLSIPGANALNAFIQTQPGVYYFSYSASVTNAVHLPAGEGYLPPMQELRDPVLAYFGTQMGLQMGKATGQTMGGDPLWLQNDGAVPVASAMYPAGEPHVSFLQANGNYNPGVWHVMPTIYNADHAYFCGMDPVNSNPEQLKAFYLDHMQLLEATY